MAPVGLLVTKKNTASYCLCPGYPRKRFFSFCSNWTHSFKNLLISNVKSQIKMVFFLKVVMLVKTHIDWNVMPYRLM